MRTITIILMGVMLSLFAWNIASAQNWQTVYETDFSTDPGWETNCDTCFYWDSTDSTLYAKQINIDSGGNYATYEAGYDGGSFLLEWDVFVSHYEYASGLTFGLCDPDRNTNSLPSYVHITFGSGYVTTLEWSGAAYGTVVVDSPSWSLDTWYHVVLEYNNDDNTMTADLSHRATGEPFISLYGTDAGPFDTDMGLVGSSNVRTGTYQVPGNYFTGKFDNVRYALAASNSLIIPSVSDLPCDDECVVQPVQTMLTEPIKGATIPIEIPVGVEVCSVSTQGLITESWDYSFIDVKPDSGFIFVALANSFGATIPEDITTVFNIFFHVTPECVYSTFIHWDTSLYDDYSRQLKFADTLAQVFNPVFDVNRDSTEILGYTPGDCTCDGAVDISDLVCMVDFMFTGGPRPCIMNSVDVNGDGGPQCDIGDLVYFVDYMFNGDPAPVCGNISAGSVAKAVAHPQIVVASRVDNGVTTISLSAPFDLRGLDLQLTGPDGAAPVKLVGEALDMVYGQDGERVKIGILDLDGGHVIPAGENRVIQIVGEYQVVSATVATDGYHSYAATIGEAARNTSLPTEFSLSQNYPNPFNPRTTISFSLPVPSEVTLTVYNVMGQKVATVADGFYEAGVHDCAWDGSSVASGVYFYRIETPEFAETRKMMLLK